jgi:hypothetical protein
VSQNKLVRRTFPLPPSVVLTALERRWRHLGRTEFCDSLGPSLVQEAFRDPQDSQNGERDEHDCRQDSEEEQPTGDASGDELVPWNDQMPTRKPPRMHVRDGKPESRYLFQYRQPATSGSTVGAHFRFVVEMTTTTMTTIAMSTNTARPARIRNEMGV